MSIKELFTKNKKTLKNLGAFVGILSITGTVGALYAPNVSAQEEEQNIVELAQATDDLSTLVTAVETAELVDALSDENSSLTVFAPTNAAFEALPDGTLDELLAPEGQDQLKDILTFHVVDSEAFAADLSDGQELTALNGDTLTVSIDGDTVRINGAQVTTADVDASNGVVHIIDSVLLPPEDETETHSPADTGTVSSSSLAVVGLATIGLVGIGILTYSSLKPNLKLE